MASRANQRILLGCVLLCAAALPCADSSRLKAAESQPQLPVASANFPTASAARLAGDGRQTRFVLDIDQTVSFRTVTLADPYRVVVDVPQVNFQLPVKLNRPILREAPLALQRRSMRQLLQQILPSAPSFESVEKLTSLIVAPIAKRGRQAQVCQGKSILVRSSSGRRLSIATPVSPGSSSAICSSKFNHHSRCSGFIPRGIPAPT